jgi:2-polyprenyl-6-hydroxyphenyl methylase/3-demethylubiquinone-9 3-methyltransferase
MQTAAETATRMAPEMPSGGPADTLDPAEIERFTRCAAEWWDSNGKFRTLHLIGPARMTFLRDALMRHFGRPQGASRPLDELSILDIGCGGGLVCEPLCRLGARVTGIDPGLDYRTARVEDLAAEGRSFDAVACLEVVEHVPDPGAFLKTCAGLVRPGGLMLLSTINRTLKAYLLAIVGAEYVLRWLPVGTHQWERFLTPDEMARHLQAAGLGAPAFRGLVYRPLDDSWSLSTDTDVNYFAASAKPPSQEPRPDVSAA